MPMSPYMRELRDLVGHRLLEIPAVSVLVLDDERRLLLVRHVEGDVWTTPGGAVEPEETPADAAVREMWEETGLAVELTGVLGVYGGPAFTTAYANGDRVSFAMTAFTARILSGDPRPDGVETLELRWFAAAELDGLATPRWAPRVLADAFAPRGPARFEPPTWSPGLSGS